MHRVFADTNFLLDVMIPDRPQSGSARRIYCDVLGNVYDMAIAAGSLKDTYYIARRYLSEEDRRDWIREFLRHLIVLPVDESACRRAIDSDEPDFEDGIVRQCAEAWNADYLLSRDVGAFRNSRPTPASMPRIFFPVPATERTGREPTPRDVRICHMSPGTDGT